MFTFFYGFLKNARNFDRISISPKSMKFLNLSYRKGNKHYFISDKTESKKISVTTTTKVH